MAGFAWHLPPSIRLLLKKAAGQPISFLLYDLSLRAAHALSTQKCFEMLSSGFSVLLYMYPVLIQFEGLRPVFQLF